MKIKMEHKKKYSSLCLLKIEFQNVEAWNQKNKFLIDRIDLNLECCKIKKIY